MAAECLKCMRGVQTSFRTFASETKEHNNNNTNLVNKGASSRWFCEKSINSALVETWLKQSGCRFLTTCLAQFWLSNNSDKNVRSKLNAFRRIILVPSHIQDMYFYMPPQLVNAIVCGLSVVLCRHHLAEMSEFPKKQRSLRADLYICSYLYLMSGYCVIELGQNAVLP